MSGFRMNWPDPGRCGCGGECARCGFGRRRVPLAIDRLARRSLSAALAHAQHGRFEAAEAGPVGTPRNGITIPAVNWTGWLAPTRIQDVLLLPKGGVSPFTEVLKGALKPAGRLYRVWMANDAARPLYIGMAYSSSVAQRLADHVRDAVPQLARPAEQHLGPRNRTFDAAQKARLAQYLKGNDTPYNASRSESERFMLRLARAAPGREIDKVMVAYGDVVPKSGGTIDVKTVHIFELALWVQERPHTYLTFGRAFEAGP